jgi:hypothetical protein
MACPSPGGVRDEEAWARVSLNSCVFSLLAPLLHLSLSQALAVRITAQPGPRSFWNITGHVAGLGNLEITCSRRKCHRWARIVSPATRWQ